MPLPTEEQLGQQTTNQRLTNIAGQSSFQDWIKLKDRNAIPNNAPSLVWLDVKPGKRVFSQPFTIDDDGVQARYTNSYWNDPKRVARMHEVIDSAPEGWQAPEWLDVEGVENLYRYFEYRNTGSTWEDWKELPGDDPGIDLANYLDQPPQDILHYQDMDPQYRAYRKIQDWYDRQLKAESDYQAAIEQQNIAAAKLIEQQYSQDTIARWDDLEPWQQFLLSRDSLTQMEGRPDWSRGIASAWTAAKTGLSVMGLTSLLFGGIGTLAAPGPGTLAGAIAGGLAGIYTGIQAYRGKENELAKLLNVFNLPAEAVERIVGMIAIQQEASAQGQALPSDSELAKRWQASKSAYEAQVLPIGNWEANAISQIARSINPDWSSGQTADQSAGEVWMFEQGYVVPQVVEGGTMAGEALLEATARINSGEDATLIYEDMVNKYGYSGTRADFIAQNFLDPNQVVPYIINRAGGNIAGAVGDQLLRQKFLEHRGSIFIDMLPMGWQQLATAVGKDWGWRSTGGIFDVLQDYGSSLRMGAMAPDGSFTLPENFSKFQIMVGQLAYNKDGILEPRVTIPDSELKTPTNRILKVLDWAGRNTPETKAIMAQANLITLIEHMLEIEPDNPVRLREILEAVANRDQAKFAEITGGYVGSPQLESVVGAARQFLDSDSYTTSIKIWEATTGKRQSLQELSIAATHDPLLPVTAAKVIELVQTGRTEELLDLIKTNPRTDNGLINNYKNRVNPETEFTNPSNFLSADAIQKRLKTFTDGTTAWHPGEFSARMLNKFVDSSTDHFVKRYDLQATNTVIRLSSLLKSAQSLYLLGLSPNFMMNNLIDGIVTTSYYGVWGVKPMSQLAKFWEEYELAIPARMNDAYGPGDITHSIFTQLNPKDLLSEAQGIVSKVNKNIGVFTTLSNKIEKMQGANAITIGTMQYLKNNWVEGVGFGKMPADLEAKLRAAGVNPDSIYALARSSKTPADFDSKFYGAYREEMVARAVRSAAKKSAAESQVFTAFIEETKRTHPGITPDQYDFLEAYIAYYADTWAKNPKNKGKTTDDFFTTLWESRKLAEEAGADDPLSQILRDMDPNKPENNAFAERIPEYYKDMLPEDAEKWLHLESEQQKTWATWDFVNNKPGTETTIAFDNETGTLIPFYHGTKQRYWGFDFADPKAVSSPEYLLFGPGTMYLTDTSSVSKGHTDGTDFPNTSGGFTKDDLNYEFYVSMHNPFDVDAAVKDETLTKILNYTINNQDYSSPLLANNIDDLRKVISTLHDASEFRLSIDNPEMLDSQVSNYQLYRYLNMIYLSKVKINKMLVDIGFDGIRHISGTNIGEAVPRNTVLIPFYSEQIKSIRNTGTFDPKNKNFYFEPDPFNNGKARGITSFDEFNRAAQRTTEAADMKTFLHEWWHVMARQVFDDDDLDVIADHYSKGTWTGLDLKNARANSIAGTLDEVQIKLLNDIEEGLVSDTEKLWANKAAQLAPTPRLAKIVAKVQEFFKNVYQALKLDKNFKFKPELESRLVKLMYGETPEESIARFDSAIKDASNDLYTTDGQPLTAELLAKTGLEDTIVENISSGMDVDSAINSAIFTVKESLEQQRWTDQLSRVESDDATLTAEGFKANLQIFGDVNAENWQKSAYLRFMVEQEFEEVHRLHRAGLHSEAEAYKIEVVDELQRQKKVQAEENNVRIATLLEHMDPDNPNHLKIAENLMAIANNWDDYYNKKITAYQTFDETVRTMPWDEKRYAALRKVLSDELNTLADEAYAFESSMHKALDEYYVDILGKTDEQHEVARAWLVNAADIKRQINDATGLAFKAMAENPAQRQNIYASFTRNEFMPLAAKLHDVYDVGAVKLDNADNSYINSEIDKLVEAAGIQPKPKVRKPKTETPAAEKPEVKIKDSVIDVDDTDTKIARTIYIDQGLAIKRDTETRLKVRQLEDAYMESVKKAFPEFAKNKGKQKLAITWMRMRAETWAIDNDSSPLDFWRVYADIDNTKNTNDALSNWIKATNKQAGYTKIPAATDMQEANGFMKAVIRATDASNFESFIHEMIHPLLYLTDDATLDVLAKYGGLEDADEYKTLRVLRDTDNLSKDLLNKLYNAEEKIVNDAVKSMAQEDFGIGLSGLLKGAFVKIRSVLVNLWKKLKGQNHEVKFSDEVNNAMSKLVLGSEEARRIYDTALKSYVDEQINQSAGDAGSIDVMLGDGRYYSTHYAFIPLKDIKLPLVPAKLLSDTKQIQDRIERFRKEFPDLFAPERITDESRRAAAFKTEAEDRTIASYDKLKSQVGYEYNLEQSRLDLSSNIHQLETKLQGITTKKRYKGQAADIRKLEGEIETLRAELSNIPQTKGQLEAKLNELVANKASQTEIAKLETELALRTPLSNNEYTLLQNLYEMKKKDAPLADSGDKAAKVRVKRTEESISRLVERLQRHGSPADRANLADLESKVMKIQQERAWLQDQKQQSVSAYEDAMSRLRTNYQEINSIRAGKNKVGLQDLEKQLPQDATLPTSRIPIIQRDGTLLYDATGITAELQAAIMGKYKQPEAINYTLDPERGDWVGQESTGDNELYLYADSALIYRFDERSKDRLQWESDNSFKLAEYRQFVDDYHTTYGLKLTQKQIDGEPGIIALIPDVDVRKFNDPIDLKRMLSYIESDKSPKVLGKFAGELAKYLGETDNMFAKAYIADITEAMVNLKYWDPLAKRGEGAWISIADPRARKVEIEAAILSERQTPIYGFRKGVLNLLEYALVRSFSKAETEQLVFGFIRKPVEAFFESDRAAAGKNVKAGEPSQYELTETRMAKLDKKIEDMVAYTDPFAKPTAKYPNVNDVVRGPYADMDTEVQSAVHIQMKQYQANLQDFLKRLEDRKNIPGAQTPSGKPVATMAMNFEYGNSKIDGIAAANTFDAIKEGKRTSTTRWSGIDDLKKLQVGDVVKFTNRKGESLNAVITRAAMLLTDTKMSPEQWSSKEGWSVDWYNKNVKPKLKSAWQIEYRYLPDGEVPTTTKAAPTFLQPLEDSFVYKIPKLRAMYKAKQITLPDITKALDDIIVGKYDPDNGLHQTLLRAALKDKLEEPAVYRWLGAWNYDVHDNRIRRLQDNLDYWVLRIKNAIALDSDTSRISTRATTDINNQYRKVAEALQRTKDSGFYALSKAEMKSVTTRMKLIKETIDTFAALRKKHDMTFRTRDNMVRKYELDTRSADAITQDNIALRDAEGRPFDLPPEDIEKVAPTQEDVQLTKQLNQFTKQHVEDSDLEFAQYFLANYGLTTEMLEQITPQDTIKLLGKTYNADAYVEVSRSTEDVGNKYMLDEYEKMLARRQPFVKPDETPTPAPQAPEVSTPRIFTEQEIQELRGNAKWFSNYTDEMLDKMTPQEIYDLVQWQTRKDSMRLNEETDYTAEDKRIEEAVKQLKAMKNQPPLPPAESGYSTQVMNNPTGSTPVPMMTGYAGAEVFDMDLYPLLSSIRDKMRKDTRSYKIDSLNTLDVDTRKAFQDWLNTTRVQLAETRRGAVDWGIIQRDNALLNYSNRTNLDAYAELAFPYQFWFTRSLGNWAKRMVSKPAMVGQMVRRQQMMQKNGRFWGSVPKRLQGKMVIPHAFSESWMGNFMYINPWQNLYPPFNLLSSVNTFNMQANSVNPVYTLTDMVNEGSITQEEMDEAMETQSGPNWEKAYARAIEKNNADLQNPVTLASMMMSPSLWITELFGDKPAENLPSTKVGTALRSIGQRTPGILGPVAGMLGKALEAPEKFIRRNNFAYYGKWGEYKVNRMIANMVADGTLDYDRGMLAMINKSGPDYELAQKRLESELSMKVSGSALADTIIAKEWTQIPLATLVTLFPGGLYPIGEEEGVQLKQEMQIAWDELGKGNPYLINNFFNEHEGHLVRTGINDGPELQMKKFLAHNLRERYDALDPVNKGLIKVQLGEGFVKSLLSGKIDYAKLTKQDLTVWLDAIGGKVPDTEIIPETQRIAADIFTDDEVKQITTYMDMREKLYPNHAWLQQNYGQLVNEIERKKYLAKFPELKLYWDWNRKYKHDHPIIGEWSGYYGNPDVGDSYQDPFYGLDKNVIQGYLNEKRQRFPDQSWQQEVYFSLPTDDERYAFIDANPSLAEAWEWDQQIEATNPTIAMYKKLKEAQYNMASNEPGTEKTPAQVSKNLALLNIHPFAIQDLVMSHSTGDPLSAGTRAELLRLFQSMGEPGGNFEEWIDSLF